MKIAIMQPYFFPYIGYFELIASVDLFVFLEDAQFTRKGWINRNRIRDQHSDFQYLTVPVKHCCRSTKINEIICCKDWKRLVIEKIIKTYGQLLNPAIIDALPSHETNKLVDILKHSLRSICKTLKISCDFASSEGLSSKRGQGRIIDICHFFGAKEYWNLSGGVDLYNQEAFGDIKLNFMRPSRFKNNLSIVDAISVDENEVMEYIHSKSWLQWN